MVARMLPGLLALVMALPVQAQPPPTQGFVPPPPYQPPPTPGFVPPPPYQPPPYQPPPTQGFVPPPVNAPLPPPQSFVPPPVIPAAAPAHVGEIHIIGNTITRDDVIRAQIPLQPGQILTYPDLRRGEANLQRLNIFEVNQDLGVRPTVEVIDPYSPSPYKDILVTVTEAATREYRFGVGVNSDAGVSGGFIFNERNFDITRFPTSVEDFFSGRAFRGGAQQFNAEIIPGNEMQRYTVNWRDPFFLDTRISLGVGGYYTTRHYLEYDDTRLGTRITLGRPLGDFWSINGGLRAEQVGVDNVQPFAPPDYLDVVGDHFITGFRAGVVYDDRDSFYRPTAGQRVELSAEQVVGDFSYPILRADAAKFFTLFQRADGSGRQVLWLRSQIGYAGNDTPVFDRFFAGGLSSIRGFSFRGVGPSANGLKIGGDFLFLNSAEYQIPVVANDNLYVVGFVDSGTVESDVEITTYRVAAGLGLRIILPILGPAPIGLDFAYPLIQADGDVKQLFSFQVGFFR